MSLNAPMATPKQIGFIHGLAKHAGLDDDTYRDFLEREAGVRSARNLTAAAADRVITTLRGSAGSTGRPVGAVAGLDSAVARKMQALWIAGHNLGIVRDRTDRAMLSFLERQTGVGHTRFLREPGASAKAIEGLKSWIAREGKVEWPADDRDAIANKRAILDAQWLRLVRLGAVEPFISTEPLGDLPAYAYRVAHKNGWEFFAPRDYDAVAAALGGKLRAALAKRRERSEQED
ncbi:regulatory protein GemA [Xanthobacteraceae bacterium Astr-EGSB]|uniref:regulatory protein GemA n=1 Tax=Astrobacterium formosum TaxID=3069710 RepID=UPI0027B411DD|nr:regulatory protein GemA [Xanthobacteraceae bacterium Astr-EGSB]